MVGVAVAANLLKTSGSFLLLKCRNHHHRQPLTQFRAEATAATRRSSSGLLGKINYNNDEPCSSPCSFPISSIGRRTAAIASRTGRMRYCTENSPAVVSSPTGPSVAPASPVEDKDDKVLADLEKIKEAANMLDIRVGRILRAWRHEEADSLYVEEVDVGEPEPRIICSGLVNYIPLHQLQDKYVVVLANLKPRNMRGVKSSGMLMAASDDSHDNVELLVPPEGSIPGERIWFGSADEKDDLPTAASPNQIQKKKIWELVQPHLKTDDSCVAALNLHYMRTSAGVVVSRSLKNANIS